MSVKVKSRRRRSQQSETMRLLQRLVRTCEDPARLVELYYWSHESDLAEIMRQIIAIPEDARNTLHAFFRLAAGDPGSVTVTANANGDVMLSSSAVEGLITAIEASIKEKSVQSLH